MKQKDIKRLERVLNYVEKAEYELETLKVSLEELPKGDFDRGLADIYLLELYHYSRMIHCWWSLFSKQGKKKPSGYDNLAELAEGKVTTANGISEDMMSMRIERTPLSTRAKNVLRYQFDTIGDIVSYCDGKWRRLRALRNVGNVTYNEIMDYLGIDDRL